MRAGFNVDTGQTDFGGICGGTMESQVILGSIVAENVVQICGFCPEQGFVAGKYERLRMPFVIPGKMPYLNSVIRTGTAVQIGERTAGVYIFTRIRLIFDGESEGFQPADFLLRYINQLQTA